MALKTQKPGGDSLDPSKVHEYVFKKKKPGRPAGPKTGEDTIQYMLTLPLDTHIDLKNEAAKKKRTIGQNINLSFYISTILKLRQYVPQEEIDKMLKEASIE